MQELTANTLKNTLWATLNEIKSGELMPETGDSIATQAREIIRTVKVQLEIAAQSKRPVPSDLISFSEK